MSRVSPDKPFIVETENSVYFFGAKEEERGWRSVERKDDPLPFERCRILWLRKGSCMDLAYPSAPNRTIWRTSSVQYVKSWKKMPVLWVYAADPELKEYTENGIEGGIRAEPFYDVDRYEAIEQMRAMYDHVNEFRVLTEEVNNKIYGSGLEWYWLFEPSITPEEIRNKFFDPNARTLEEIQEILDWIRQQNPISV